MNHEKLLPGFRLLIGFVSLLLTIFSIFTFEILSGKSKTTLVVILLFIAIAYLFYESWYIFCHNYHVEFEINQKAKIHEYMTTLISNTGNTLIVTRDLSWAQMGDENHKILLLKAQKRELTIILQNTTSPNVVCLGNNGAEIIDYNKNRAAPITLKKRFTILDFDTSYATIITGGPSDDGKKWIIEKFDAKSPVYFLALDLISALKK